jgi:hypothetical protein
MKQTARQAFVGARSGHFQSMMHGFGPGPVPFSIARKYWSIASDRARDYVARGGWQAPTSMQVWYEPQDKG